MKINKIVIIHALDETTKFLTVFKENFKEDYYVFHPNKESEVEILNILKSLPEHSTVVFLGHGTSTGLYTPENIDNYPKKIFLNQENGQSIFNNKQVLLLSCNSCQFISRLDTFKEIIGFGNIISSTTEIGIDADLTGIRRTLDKKDIDFFNSVYCNSIISSLLLYKNGIIQFSKANQYIEFFINKEINKILIQKEMKNKIEIAKLLFEFRNEMKYKKIK